MLRMESNKTRKNGTLNRLSSDGSDNKMKRRKEFYFEEAWKKYSVEIEI